MRQRDSLPLICHASVGAILACAFVGISVPQIWPVIRAYSAPRVQPFHTTDGYLLSLAKVSNGSARLEQAFSTLPKDRPVAVLLPEGSDEGTFLHYLVSYFAWPREVRPIALTRDRAAEQFRSLDRHSLGAMFFCGVDPPAGLQPVVHLGADLVMVPTAADEKPSAP